MADIVLKREEAERLCELYENIESADSIYKRCQSDYFRLHVQNTYKNDAIASAFASVKKQLENHVPENSTKKASKGVLS